MKRAHSFISLLVILFASCSSESDKKQDEPKSGQYPINIDVANAEWFEGDFHELIEDVYYVALDTQMEALFAEKTKLLFSENKIIVFDRRLQQVVVFDEDGDFLFKIHRPGEGPGEYMGLWTIAYDEEFDEYILAAMDKVLWYNGTGDFIKEKKSPYVNIGDMASLNNRQLATFFDLSYSGDSSIRAAIVDSELNTLGRYLPFPNDVRIENITGFYSHFSAGKQPLATGVYWSEILRFTADSAYAEYFVDFGKDALPDDFMDTYLMDQSYNAQAVRDVMAEKNYWSIYGGAANETKDHVLFICTNRKEYNQALYNKKTGEVLTFNANLDEPSNKNAYVYFQTTFNNYFVVQGKSSFLLELYGLLNPNADVEAVEEAIENEVPVLWFVKFKDSHSQND
ncbi:MAG: 6-bladed beta-propeller [Cytophagia bacterium]|nr:6-bladed beta-propeller [Cytophagia bacterium]